jgi:hypothetical protein
MVRWRAEMKIFICVITKNFRYRKRSEKVENLILEITHNLILMKEAFLSYKTSSIPQKKLEIFSSTFTNA